MSEKNKISVIDAEYHIDIDRGYGTSIPERRRGPDNTVKKIVVSIWLVVLWCVRQVGSLMIDGVSGTIDGIKEASELDSRIEPRGSRMPRMVREKKPIWYIPTKEEEDYERMRSRGR
jgi:hypothetical protein